jgi:hypothetical protein
MTAFRPTATYAAAICYVRFTSTPVVGFAQKTGHWATVYRAHRADPKPAFEYSLGAESFGSLNI